MEAMAVAAAPAAAAFRAALLEQRLAGSVRAATPLVPALRALGDRGADTRCLLSESTQQLKWGHSVEHFLRRPLEKCGAGAAPTMPHSVSSENSVTQRHDYYTIGDFMTLTKDLFCAKPSTTVDEALEMLVENRITGLPVVDDNGKLVGVVSDYDLLALDSISGKRPTSNSLFPEPGSTWKAFREIQHLLTKTQGKTVGDVMTSSPLVVREDMNLEDAARILLDTKYRRLPVVDESGKLVGLITRGNVVRAALVVKRDAEKQKGS